MALPARSAPNIASRFALAAPDAETADRLRAAWVDAIEHVRRTRPGDGTEEERECVLRFVRSSMMTLAIFEGGLPELLRLNLDDSLRELVREELATSEVERKLALRQLEFAAQVAGVVFEQVAALLDALPDGSDVAQEVAEHVEHVDLSGADLTVVRFQLDLMVALESFDAPLEELTYWAKRAVTGARRVQALSLPVSPAGLRGELARLRARSAWRHWDAEELERELAPWPDATPSS